MFIDFSIRPYREEVVKYSKQVIKKEINPQLQVDGWVNGIKYRLGFFNLTIGQLYPLLD